MDLRPRSLIEKSLDRDCTMLEHPHRRGLIDELHASNRVQSESEAEQTSATRILGAMLIAVQCAFR